MKGYIRTKQFPADQTNGFGEIVQGVPTESELVECMYSANNSASRGVYQDGEFIKTSFVITTDKMDFSGSVLSLFDSKKSHVCEKEVLSLEVLEDIQRVKIII